MESYAVIIAILMALILILAAVLTFAATPNRNSVDNQTCFSVHHVMSGNSAVMYFDGHTYDNVIIKECPTN
jgi:hypothetical protein